MPDALLHARAAYDAGDWSEANEQYAAAAADGSGTDGDDLERWAWANLWRRDPGAAIETFERACEAQRRAGRADAEARLALIVAQLGFLVDDPSAAATALARARRALAETPECEAHALEAWADGYLLGQSDPAAARPHYEEALAVARRVGSLTVEALARMSLARTALELDADPAALLALDEAAGLALDDAVVPLAAGFVLCGTIGGHREVGDWKGAASWTDATQRWIARTRVSLHPGLCSVHRCEVSRMRGDLDEAEQHVLDGCAELAMLNRPILGFGYHELAQVRLRRGDLAGAEAAARDALAHGWDAQPALGQLRLARGEVAGALTGLVQSLETPALRSADRLATLSTIVTAALAAGDLALADDAASRLEARAERFRTDVLAALVDQARGEIAVATGDLATARTRLHAAWAGWCAAQAPFEAASTRVLLGRVGLAEGDAAAARLDLEAARDAFARIGATLGVERVDELLAEISAGVETARTFLCSDIVDSTRLQQAMGDDAWARLLAWHDRTLRDRFAARGGEEVKHSGDGFLVAFPSPTAAAAAACDVQEALAAHRRDHGFAPEVRVGIHAGTARARGHDYYGLAVSETARIADAAVGGEVLCSVAALPAAGFRVGEARELALKGVEGPVTVHALAREPTGVDDAR